MLIWTPLLFRLLLSPTLTNVLPSVKVAPKCMSIEAKPPRSPPSSRSESNLWEDLSPMLSPAIFLTSFQEWTWRPELPGLVCFRMTSTVKYECNHGDKCRYQDGQDQRRVRNGIGVPCQSRNWHSQYHCDKKHYLTDIPRSHFITSFQEWTLCPDCSGLYVKDETVRMTVVEFVWTGLHMSVVGVGLACRAVNRANRLTTVATSPRLALKNWFFCCCHVLPPWFPPHTHLCTRRKPRKNYP